MLDNHLEQAFTLAVEEARKRLHEFVTLEHLLYGIILEQHGKLLLDEVGADIPRLTTNLEYFFEENLTPLPQSRNEIVQTLALQRVIQRAMRQMQASGREKISIGDVLASLLEEDNSYAAYFLLAQGVSRLDILEHISYDIGGISEDLFKDENTEANEKALKSYTIDLTAQARDGKLDPLIGRQIEIERAVQILARRRKNNPLFVGDPGVGKTALAEGLAQMIVSEDVPSDMKKSQIFSLDLGGMMAGAKYRGDFEGRLKAVMAAINDIPDAILFIDEIHTIVGAGAVNGGSLDASNILKPALASGEIRCIGSTTHEELRNHFEKDKAFSRRFQKIDVPEPSQEECVEILKGLKSRYEEHHGVRYTPEALEAAVNLSVRYLTEARLPDKAIDLIDEAGAKKRLSIPESDDDSESNTKPHRVGVKDIESVVAIMARVPSVRASSTDRASLKNLEIDLKKLVFGQDKAVDNVTKAILRSRAGFNHADRPQGSFLFYGPTGVGKTELAKQLAHCLDVPFLRYDMSEYMEKHAVARLIGAPPGYVGFDQGGLLTEAIRKTPNAVLLLDEIEKAHPDIYNVLLQVMDYATLTDTSGRKADFRNVTIIMTTNAGAFEMSARSIGFGESTGPSHSTGRAKKALERLFTPEFRNRLDAMVDFAPLSRGVMINIVDKFVKELQASLDEKDVSINLSESTLNYLADRGYDPVFGARPLARVIREDIEDVLSGEILFGELSKGGVANIDTVEDDQMPETNLLDGVARMTSNQKLVFTYGKKAKTPPKKAKSTKKDKSSLNDESKKTSKLATKKAVEPV